MGDWRSSRNLSFDTVKTVKGVAYALHGWTSNRKRSLVRDPGDRTLLFLVSPPRQGAPSCFGEEALNLSPGSAPASGFCPDRQLPSANLSVGDPSLACQMRDEPFSGYRRHLFQGAGFFK